MKVQNMKISSSKIDKSWQYSQEIKFKEMKKRAKPSFKVQRAF